MTTRSLALVLIVAITLGCGSKPATPPAPAAAEPSLADQLAAAKELAQFAEEEYRRLADRLTEMEALLDRAQELGNQETIDRTLDARSKLREQVNGAQREWNAAKRKVASLARQIAEP